MPTISVELRVLAVLALALVGGGCRESALPLPSVYPATGKVTAPGGMTMEGATVEFTPVGASSEFMAKGGVDSEGKFKLRMAHRRGMIDGAPEGCYSVAVYMPLHSDRSGERVELDEQFTIAPRENHFTIDLPATH